VAKIGARVFVSSGGMGSTYLANRLRKAGVFSVEKPFVNAFFTHHWPEVLCRRIPERPFVADLNQPPTEAVRASFQAAQERYANLPRPFEGDATQSLERNMAAYLRFLQEVGASCVLRGTSVEGLLSRWGVRDVVFMIRRPAEGFFSYSKPERHGDMIDALGGVESPEAAAFYAASWNAVAGEYLACLEAGLTPRLIRYESAVQDAAAWGEPALEALFDELRPLTGPAPLPQAVCERLEALTEPYLSRLYP
jgi:hypothetical protein